jgi:hypothetical protein
MALGWPNINAQAELTLNCCGERLVAKVASYTEAECVLEAPEHGCEEPQEAETHILNWLSQDAYWSRAVEVRELATQSSSVDETTPEEGALQSQTASWILAAFAECERFERRAFVRLDAEFPVTAMAANNELCTFTAIDISEHGLRGVITPEQTEIFPAEFSLHLHLDAKIIIVEARVAWVGTDTTTDDEHTFIGLLFSDPPESTTDAIRSYIFRLQMARRREENEKTARL